MKRLLIAGAGLLLALNTGARAESKIDFEKQILPILSESCFKCHAGAKHKGDLKLDSAEAIRKGGKDSKGKVIVAGSPDKSDMYRRIILPKDDDDAMPPDGKAKPVSKKDAELVKAWIAQGADFGAWKEFKKSASAAPGDKGAGEAKSANAAADEGPKEIALPQVGPADAAAAGKLRSAGALVLPLAQDSNLLSVEFTSNAPNITDEQLALLDPISAQIYELNLAGSRISNEGLSHLSGLKNLHRLHLEKTAIGDPGLAHLKNLTSLEYLNLYNTQVSDAGLNDLCGLTSLKRLYLWQSRATDAGAENLKKCLPSAMIDLGWKEPTAAATQIGAKGKE